MLFRNETWRLCDQLLNFGTKGLWVSTVFGLITISKQLTSKFDSFWVRLKLPKRRSASLNKVTIATQTYQLISKNLVWLMPDHTEPSRLQLWSRARSDLGSAWLVVFWNDLRKKLRESWWNDLDPSGRVNEHMTLTLKCQGHFTLIRKCDSRPGANFCLNILWRALSSLGVNVDC